MRDEHDTREKQRPSEAGCCLIEIRVKGQLSDQWRDWFENLDIRLLENGEMILSGATPDQAALMGILNKINRLNLTLLSVNKVSHANSTTDKETKMNIVQTLNRRLEAIAWGVFFVWWGITELFPVLPEGAGVIGIGVILLGLNLARSVNGIPTSGFTITLGILALVLGTLEFSRQLLRLPFDLPIFGILLIVLGVIFLVRELTGKQSQPG